LVGYDARTTTRAFVAREFPMMSRDERLLYWEKIEEAQAVLLADPEIAAEYARASEAWDSTVGVAAREEGASGSSAERRPAGLSLSRQTA
jgi:hypothetical protein